MRRHLNPRYRELLGILSDGRFHSGTELGEKMNTSRTTIAKYVRRLQDMGLDIYVVKGNGYALPESVELLDEDRINSEVGGAPVKVFDMIDSTNSYMMSYLDNFEVGSCILAETQTRGVGRANSVWISPFACQVIISMYWRMNPSVITGLSLAVGVATIRALEKFGVGALALKWPNDIYYNNRKLAGILVESRSTMDEKFHVVVGTGLNAISSKSLNQNCEGAIALGEITGQRKISRNDLIITLIKEYRSLMTEFEGKGFAPYHQEWNSRDLYRGERVKLVNKISGETIVEGVEHGIDCRGRILIENSRGALEAFNVGDVSLQY